MNLAKGMLRSFALPIQRGTPRISGAGRSPAPLILGLKTIGGAKHRQ
ncbi:hypothetical protein APA_3031 [Pseudanabaena sp. lw0831]|nr:hypothetical protein APA_3031 [Pseudanabaena sp. lw0831]